MRASSARPPRPAFACTLAHELGRGAIGGVLMHELGPPSRAHPAEIARIARIDQRS
jgi:hypothetical protein